MSVLFSCPLCPRVLSLLSQQCSLGSNQNPGISWAALALRVQLTVSPPLVKTSMMDHPSGSEHPNICVTLWLFNIAIENSPFIDDFPTKTTIYRGFSMAMLNNQRVFSTYFQKFEARRRKDVFGFKCLTIFSRIARIVKSLNSHLVEE